MPPLIALATTDNAMLLLVANYCRGGHKVPDTAMARSSVTARGQTAVLTIRHSGAASLASMLSASLASASISSLLFAKQLIYRVGVVSPPPGRRCHHVQLGLLADSGSWTRISC